MPLFFSKPAESRCKACEWTWTSEDGQSKYCPKCGSSKVDNMSNVLRASGGVTLCLLIAGAGAVGIALYNGWNPASTANWIGERFSAATAPAPAATKDASVAAGPPSSPSELANPNKRKLTTELEPPRHAPKSSDGSAGNPAAKSTGSAKTAAPKTTAPKTTAPKTTPKPRPTPREPDDEPTPPKEDAALEAELVGQLGSPDAEQRYKAAARLGQLDKLSEPTLEALRRAAKDADAMVRVAANYALRKVGKPAPVTTGAKPEN